MNGHMKTIKAIRVAVAGFLLLTIQVFSQLLNHIWESTITYTCSRWLQSLTTSNYNFHFSPATLNVCEIITLNKRPLSAIFWQLSYRWIKITILLQYFNILLCVNPMHCANVSSTKDYNQLNIYGNGIASCNARLFPLTFCTYYIFRHLMMFLTQTWTFW